MTPISIINGKSTNEENYDSMGRTSTPKIPLNEWKCQKKANRILQHDEKCPCLSILTTSLDIVY